MSDPQSDAITAEPDNHKGQREQSEQKTLNDTLSDTPNKSLESKSLDGKGQASHQLYDTVLADQAIRLEVLLKDKRFWKSLSTLSMLASVAAVDRLVGGRYKKRSASEARRRTAKLVKQALIEMGATFIKLGQFLSVRKDIISEELAEELVSLQDQVPPFDYESLCQTIERELGAPPDKLFKEFETTPIASASIGQVHRARLQDGRAVVVKVQRPDLSDIFYRDLGYMRLIAKIGPIIRPSQDWSGWLALSDEFGRTLFEEIDYIKEGRNADRIRQILKDQKTLRVPRVFWKLTGRKVLTLEYLPGVKIDNKEEIARQGIDPVAIGNNLVAAYMEQVLMHGFFHADPHAGNLAVGPDGRIVIYDFGMIGEISQSQREAILGCIAAVINMHPDELIKNLATLGIVKEGAKQESMVRAVQPFIEYYKGKQIKELDFSDLEHDIDQIAMDRSLKLPPSLAYLLRTGSSLEGIARSLHPNFSFVEAAKPSVKKWALANPAQAYFALGYLTRGKLFGQKGVFSEEGLIRLFSSTNAGEESATGKLLPRGNKTKSSLKTGSVSQSELELQKEHGRRLQEIRKLETQIYILDREVKSLSKNRVNLLWTGLMWFSLSLVFWGITSASSGRQFTEYYLIGNGVMVAIIVWQIVRPLGMANRKRSNGSTGRRR
ncbi:AarF/ABC1/UbiB kinase family protein [bacterium]|jgi:predicted unusual protein kinase regulating ubiquinone biosynthesis (AarF/ABC1/UbiB family)|nr:AarF/ABC1/UbiB kinase family protein [bacterium]